MRYSGLPTGISFTYPSTWQLSSSSEQYLPVMIEDNRVQIVQSVVFSPKDDSYQHTNLISVAFTAAIAKLPGSAACRAFSAKISDASSTVGTVLVHGISFTEVDGGDAGMSHRQTSTVDSTWQNGQCYLFERDAMTLAPGVKPGTHELTVDEEKALQRDLAAIFASVYIDPICGIRKTH